MEKIGVKKYKTLFPDSMINNNKILYHQTNRRLNSFLLKNFSSNSLIKYKFPIKKQNSSIIKKTSIKKKSNTIINQRRSISEKSNIRTIIENLRHDNCKSYNYYDDTKGPLQSSERSKNKNQKIIKQKSYSNFYIKSINDSNKSNINALSFDPKIKTPKNNFLNSKVSLFLKNKKKFRNKKNIENNVNSFSFSNYNVSKKQNISKNISRPDSLSSTRYKSNVKIIR